MLISLCSAGTIGVNIAQMHLRVWPLSLLFALIPLTTAGYGRQDPNSVIEWCYLHDDNIARYMAWNILNWILFVLVVVIFMFYFSRRVYIKVFPARPTTSSLSSTVVVGLVPRDGRFTLDGINAVDQPDALPVTPVNVAGQTIFTSLVLFPLVLCFTYVPFAAVNIIVYFQQYPSTTATTNYSQTVLLGCFQLLSLFYGISLGVLFYARSPEARKRWRSFYCHIKRRSLCRNTLPWILTRTCWHQEPVCQTAIVTSTQQDIIKTRWSAAVPVSH